ncbi:unknown_gene_7465 [Phodopus roborovskii]|uniref:Unknown_gene_7465 protein n=1 Tax=Phodopus roborovskii TaxID=109678 RepID=A0AAV0A0Q0_PHORO|nr:unknown_gene_7465 [Phodopus roborovskii]
MFLFTFRFTCVLEIMLFFFWLILLVLPWVDATVNHTSGTTSLSIAIQPRQNIIMKCHQCSQKNTFNCPREHPCNDDQRRCGTIAVRMSSRALLVYKHCMRECTFVHVQPPPTELSRRLPSTNSFYYSNCCSGVLCNDGGPTNVERDLLPPLVVEEEVVARAVSPGECNLLLTLALILSSSILT